MKEEKTNMKKGFTLIEILFSLAIISLVVGIGISQMSGATSAAKKVVAKADVRTAIMGQHIAFSETGSYVGTDDLPTYSGTIDGLAAGGDANKFCVSVSYDDNGTDKYILYSTTDGEIANSTAPCTDASTTAATTEG